MEQVAFGWKSSKPRVYLMYMRRPELSMEQVSRAQQCMHALALHSDDSTYFHTDYGVLYNQLYTIMWMSDHEGDAEMPKVNAVSIDGYTTTGAQQGINYLVDQPVIDMAKCIIRPIEEALDERNLQRP